MINNQKLYSACRQQPLEVANWDGEKKGYSFIVGIRVSPFLYQE